LCAINEQKEGMILVARKIGRLSVLLSISFLLTACSIFADTQQKTSSDKKTNSKNTKQKVVQQQKIKDIKLNPKSVIVKDNPKNKKFPKEIIPLIQTLVADDEKLQRSAIAPELIASFPKGRLFPKNTIIYIDTKNWRQQDYLPKKSVGNIIGNISMPKKTQQNILITFIYKQQEWKVTLTEVSPTPTKKPSSKS
jgi:hypothetical protein